jgi:hypothetical protein
MQQLEAVIECVRYTCRRHLFGYHQVRYGPQSPYVTPQFPTSVSYRSSAFLRVTRLMVLVTQLSAILHAGSGLLSTVSLPTFYVLRDSLYEIDPYLCPRVWFCSSIAYKGKLIYLILPAALGPVVYSSSNRNEYQKHKNNNVSGE